jgi:hypothetical protein
VQRRRAELSIAALRGRRFVTIRALDAAGWRAA